MRKVIYLTLACLVCAMPVRADFRTRAATELAEGLIARFGAKAGSSVPALASRIESLAIRHGEEAFVALRKCGPSALGLIEAAGADSGKVVRILSLHGEQGMARVLTQPAAMRQYLRFGEGAASALVKHPGIAEKLVEKGGMPAVRALETLTPQNGRRLAMMFEGELANVGKHPELLEVIAKYGDRAAVFVWENKGALAVGTVLTAFLANPEPFINGTKEIAKTVGESAVKPLAAVPGEVAKGIVGGVNWTVVILVVAAGVVLYVMVPRTAWWVVTEPVTKAAPASPPTQSNVAIQPEGEKHGIK